MNGAKIAPDLSLQYTQGRSAIAVFSRLAAVNLEFLSFSRMSWMSSTCVQGFSCIHVQMHVNRFTDLFAHKPKKFFSLDPILAGSAAL